MRKPSDQRQVPYLIAMAGFLFAGCAGARPASRLTTETVAPSSLGTGWQIRVRASAPQCAQDPAPPLTPDSEEVVAGYLYKAPLTLKGCRTSTGVVYRGAMMFPVSDAGGGNVTKATLTFRRGGIGSECGVSAYVATGEWWPGFGEGFFPAPRDPKRFMGRLEPKQAEVSADVTTVVREWVHHERINFGVVFMADDESYPEKDAFCMASISEAHLTVVRSQKK